MSKDKPKSIICIRCSTRGCEKSAPDEFGICNYGVAFYNKGDRILRKETLVPLSFISRNLRHELHKFLQAIVSEANTIDESLTTKSVDLGNPSSRIVGLTIAIDHFVQMLAGVNEFHSLSIIPRKKDCRRLSDLVRKYFSIHSIIRNERRATDLKLSITFGDNIYIPVFADIFEYLFSVLMDNAWKYSLANTTVRVSANLHTQGLADVEFSNESNPLPEGFNVFGKGTQVDENSEGFGYGLFWALILVDHYNSLSGANSPVLDLIHEEKRLTDNVSEQKFILRNVPVEIKE